MRSRIVIVALGCACTHPPESGSLDAPPATIVAEPQREPVAPAQPPPPPTPAWVSDDPNVFVGTIVDQGPIACGRCVQQSYEIDPADPTRDNVWIHYERCGRAGPSPEAGNLEGLELGATLRFTVRPGASENYGAALILMAAKPQ